MDTKQAWTRAYRYAVSSVFRTRSFPLNNHSGQMPAVGFGNLIPDAALTIAATRNTLDAGFRHFDCAERYRNEPEVGTALQAGLTAGGIARGDIFVTTKLWNSNHRPERVEPAFAASLDRLRINYLDLYLIHTPFAFQSGDEQDPRDQNGNVIYDDGVTLLDTWKAMEGLVDQGKCRAIGLSDITLDKLAPFTNRRESSHLWSRSNHIRTCRKRSSWNSARRTALSFWHSPHWVTACGRGCLRSRLRAACRIPKRQVRDSTEPE